MPATSAPASRLLLIDGHALAYRAYFALMRRSFSTKDGHPTGAIYGFTKMLLEAIGKLRPNALIVSFDRPKKTFRHEAFADYKAHRKAMDDDLQIQMEPIREIVRAFDIPIFELDGYEADDILGTLSRQAAESGMEVLILTGDRDAFQLVDERVNVLLPQMGVSDLERFGPAEVEAKMGVRPDQIPDLKGLMGDSSDNIPGVPGIGEKGAVKLLKEFDTLEGLYARLDSVAGKTQDKLRENEALARLCKQLATIDRRTPVELDGAAYHLTMPDVAKLSEVLARFEFTSIIRQLPQALAGFGAQPGGAPLQTSFLEAAAEAAAAPELQALELAPRMVVDEPGLMELASAIAEAGLVSIDTETDGLNAQRCKLVGLAIAVGGPRVADCLTFYVPVGHEDTPGLGWEAIRPALAPAFADPGKTWLGHNLKFDLNVLARYDLVPSGTWKDTMLADYLVESGRESHGLKELAAGELGYAMTPIQALIGTGQKAITMAQVPAEKAAPYASADVAVTRELWEKLAPQLVERNQQAIFEELEMPLMPILLDMERRGIAIDKPYLAELSERLGGRIRELEARVHELAGESFNLNSPKQLAVILFEKLGLPVLKRTKTGPSTDASVLEELAPQHPMVDALLEYRQLTKLKSTYVDALPLLADPGTHCLHTTFNQTVAATGRLSSSDPNLQNIPIRTELGREIRRAFVPSTPGNVLVSADYSQIELRVLAHITEDPSFIKAFSEDLDIHTVTAGEIYGVPLAEVTPEMRRRAKTTNFGVVYGQTDFGLSRALRIPRAEAREFIERFNARYPGIQHYIIRTLAAAKRDGYVETLSGRRRYLPDINAKNRVLRDVNERMAINAPIQGSAADIIKKAMIRVAPELPALGAALLLQVHDELVVECPAERAEAVMSLLRAEMESAWALRVPLKVEAHAGPNWRDAK